MDTAKLEELARELENEANTIEITIRNTPASDVGRQDLVVFASKLRKRAKTITESITPTS
jgi:hypothetical protein